MIQLRGRAAAWADRSRRAAAAPRAPAVVGALLGLVAVTEPITRAANADLNAKSLPLNLFAAVALALATTVPGAFLSPTAAAVASCLATVLSLAVFRTLTVAGAAALLIALFRLGLSCPPRSRARLLGPVLSVPLLVLALTDALARADAGGTEATVLTIVLAAIGPTATWAGISARAQREAVMQDAVRQVIADTVVEHTALGERARIARELHDVVAHHISMIVVQTETARLTTPGLSAAGAQRLSEIGDTAREGLTEMRRLVGVLREEGRPSAADRHPQPRLEDLNELLDGARNASGRGIRLIVSGAPVAIDPGTALAAYRIVQEALTNARRHAPGAAVDVELRWDDDTLRLRVRDDGPGLSRARLVGDGRTDGHGLQGMRERASAVGGELSSGNAKGGGFAIEAALPVKAAARHRQPAGAVPRARDGAQANIPRTSDGEDRSQA